MRLGSAIGAARRSARAIVVPYVMVDRSRRARLRSVVTALREGGATALELGFPFSDPIADGPVLAAAHEHALLHGTSWDDLIHAVRVSAAILPTAVMTYANPLVHRGIDRSVSALAGAGAIGLIVPDLSLEESAPFRAAARRHRLDLVLLAAPGTEVQRMAAIARGARGFLYLVSHYGTTGGTQRGTSVDLRPLVAAARRARPDLPILIGFGVRDARTARRALATGVDGVIVGTALEERLSRGDTPDSLRRFVAAIAAA